MRTPEVANATAAGSWNFCSDTAAPTAMTAATTQETMKTHMFVSSLEGRSRHYGLSRADIKRVKRRDRSTRAIDILPQISN